MPTKKTRKKKSRVKKKKSNPEEKPDSKPPTTTVKSQFTKTKIVATVGPSSNSKEVLNQMVDAGVDVFRLNFSHGSHSVHTKTLKLKLKIQLRF